MIMVTYVGTYYGLTRLDMYLTGDSDGFCYVPTPNHEVRWIWAVHYPLVIVYWPVWILDHSLLGGPHWDYMPDGDFDG